MWSTGSYVNCVEVLYYAVCSEASLLSYGDLELFLAGIGLSSLVPLFKQHHISFSEFLRLTDSDLQKV